MFPTATFQTDYFRVDGGKIVEHEVIWDQLQMMGQRGALSPS